MPRTLAGLRSGYTVPRGIIVPVGNDQFIYAVHLLATIVHTHGVKFPIHVVYAGNDDLVPEKRAALRSISPNVDTVDILNYFDEGLVGIHGGGWAIKVFAILASPFQEVIIADADAVFVQNPEVMFDDPGYNATGTLFFRDREIFPGDGQVHEWFHGVMKGREPSAQLASSRWWTDMASREEMESGVVVFDKRRTSVVYGLLYAGWLNTRVVREEVTYKNTYGGQRVSYFAIEQQLTSRSSQATRNRSGWFVDDFPRARSLLTTLADVPFSLAQAFELCGLPYHLDREYAGIIGQLTHTDTKSHSIDTFIQSDHLFHLDYSASRSSSTATEAGCMHLSGLLSE